MLQPNDLVHGRYRIVRQIGSGGFGAVYEATDESLRHRVALKLSQIAVPDPNQMAMLRKAFEHEAQILARLRNPGLPRVTHYFTDGDAQYLVMDYIPGGNMAEALHSRSGQPFPPADVVRWAVQLLDILDYLHGEGIVHRDIKPANMKLTRQGRREQMVLLDFGLAKGQVGTDSRASFAKSFAAGTLAYAPPEQLHLGDRGTDGRSDLFSLAATLYELVTGQQPPSVMERGGALSVGTPDPLRPPHLLVPAVPPALSDALLAALVMKKEYRTPDAATMRAALPAPGAATGAAPGAPLPPTPPTVPVPTSPQPVEPVYPTPPQVGTSAGVPTNANPTTAPAARPAPPAPPVSAPTPGYTPTDVVPESPTPPPPPAPPFRLMAVLGGGAALLVGLVLLFAVSGGSGDADPPAGEGQAVSSAPTVTVVGAEDNGSAEPITASNAADVTEPDTLTGHTDEVNSVAYSPDGTRLASGSSDGTVKLWDVATGTEVATLTGHTDEVTSVAFSPDGTRLASGSRDYTVKLWDVATGDAVATRIWHGSHVEGVAFSPDGTRLASGSGDRTVKLWDVATGDEVATLTGHTDWVHSVAFSPDGTRLASGSGSVDGTVKLWDVATGDEVATLTGHGGRVSSVAYSPDGTRLAVGSYDDTVKLWDVATGTVVATLTGHDAPVNSVAFSPDGTRLASGSVDDTVKLWDVATGDEVATLTGHSGAVWSVAYSPDGTLVASVSLDNTVKLWEVAPR